MVVEEKRGGDEEEVVERERGGGAVGGAYPCVRAEWDGGTSRVQIGWGDGSNGCLAAGSSCASLSAILVIPSA